MQNEQDAKGHSVPEVQGDNSRRHFMPAPHGSSVWILQETQDHTMTILSDDEIERLYAAHQEGRLAGLEEALEVCRRPKRICSCAERIEVLARKERT